MWLINLDKIKEYKISLIAILFLHTLLFPHNSLLAQSNILKSDSSIKQKDTFSTHSMQVLPSKDSLKLFVSLINNNSQPKYSIPIDPHVQLFVDDYIRRNSTDLNRMKIWGRPYFDLYDHILTSYGVPVQLKYLSVIESSLNSGDVSWAGAVGPWQLMTDEAQQYGLHVGSPDDRFDYVKSTTVAAQILKKLYSTYKDWLLVIAAYNCGPGNVDKAISKANSNNFWDMQYYLPEETRNHVKKFIATHYFFEGNGSITTMTAKDAASFMANIKAVADTTAYHTIIANASTIKISGRYNSAVIANALLMDTSLFKQLNPDMDNSLAKGETYSMRLPQDKAALFQTKRNEIIKQSVDAFLNASNRSSNTIK